MFEGDPAPADPFEELVNIKTENGIGRQGAERLVPWLKKNAERQSDYLVVFCDPRMKSTELQQAVQNIVVDLPAPMLSRTIVINADTPAENRRWLKKSGLEGKIDVYSDEKMDWMRAYTALGDQRWSMTMYVIADEPSISIPRRMLTSWCVRQFVNSSVTRTNQNKVTNRALALLITPLDYPLASFTAGLCRSRLSRFQSLTLRSGVTPRGANTPFRLGALFYRVVSYKPSEYFSRVLILALASEYRSIMPMLGRTPCDFSCFRQRWFASTTLSGIPWFCA
jgi:hypothetical protein